MGKQSDLKPAERLRRQAVPAKLPPGEPRGFVGHRPAESARQWRSTPWRVPPGRPKCSVQSDLRLRAWGGCFRGRESPPWGRAQLAPGDAIVADPYRALSPLP